jgi:hypothetical protein
MDEQNNPGQRKKNQDRSRDIAVYQYLLGLTNGCEDLPNILPSEKGANIAKQWGTDKMFVQRVLWNLYPKIYVDDSGKKKEGLPSLDLDKLVDILASLRDYCSGQDRKARKISRLDVVRGLRLFCKLTPGQEESLGLQANQSKVLLHRLEDSINNLSPKLVPEIITKIYKYFLSTKVEAYDRNKLTSEQKWNSIEKYLFRESNRDRDDTEKELIIKTQSKVTAEESKIQIEDGSNRHEFYNSESNVDKSSYLSASTMEILIKSVIENEETTSKLPIYFKYIEIKKNRALPLYMDENNLLHLERKDTNLKLTNQTEIKKNDNGVLDYQLHRDRDKIKDNRTEPEFFSSVDSLKSIFSYTVKVHFYIKLPQDNNQLIDNKDRQESKQYIDNKDPNLDIDFHRDGSQLIVNFFEEVSGIGSIISHVIAAINRVLLWDIPLLNKYIPIAKKIVVKEEYLGSSPNSTIWGHSVVCLCKRVDVRESIDKNELYDKVFNTQEYACGDYCGFDILEVIAKSAFYARLRAIEQTGVNPEQYIKECINRIREVNAFRKAQSLLNDYPFSVRAMEEYIENNIFNKKKEYKYRKLCEESCNIEFEELSETHWSMVAYESHLAIAEANLKEGLFKRAKKYLHILEKHIEKHKNSIDSLFIAKYYLSEFRYHCLFNHRDVVDFAETALRNSKEYLSKYTKKCHAIDELPMVNFHDFFYISSRISAHEAKIDLFMRKPSDTGKRREYLSKAIYLFEKARIDAAKDGSVSMYSMWTAYQSWCYTMEAYLVDKDTDENDYPRSAFLKMADVRLDHALVCYSENGRKCYEAIKINAGKLRSDDKYDDINIKVIPLIRELNKEDTKDRKPDSQKSDFDPDKNILTLDMSVFSRDYPPQYGRGNVKNTLLFGMPSTLLLFALGMRSLCRKYTLTEDFFESIEESIKFFNYSWCISEEGLQKAEEDRDGRKTYNRRFPKAEKANLIIDEMAVIGLYPRRITQFADLSKLFSIVCYLLLLMDNKKKQADKNRINEKIEFLIKKIDENADFNDVDRVLGQTEYNSHFLKEIRIKFKQYVEKWRSAENLLTSVDNTYVLQKRNEIVRDVFYIITTQSSP